MMCMKGYIIHIEQETLNNTDFRRVLYTGRHSQLVLMSIEPGDEIGAETHADVDQFLRIESGEGKAVIDGKERPLEDGSAIVVPAGARHNIINTSQDKPLKLYTIYSPPEHLDKTIHTTKADALQDENDHFDGTTTE